MEPISYDELMSNAGMSGFVSFLEHPSPAQATQAVDQRNRDLIPSRVDLIAPQLRLAVLHLRPAIKCQPAGIAQRPIRIQVKGNPLV